MLFNLGDIELYVIYNKYWYYVIDENAIHTLR